MSEVDKEEIISEIEEKNNSSEKTIEKKVVSRFKGLEKKIDDLYNGEIEYLKNKCNEYENDINERCKSLSDTEK